MGRRTSGLHPRLVESNGLRDELLVSGHNLPEDRCVCQGNSSLHCSQCTHLILKDASLVVLILLRDLCVVFISLQLFITLKCRNNACPFVAIVSMAELLR